MNLILNFCSITPNQLSNEINQKRIIEYQRSISQLKRLTQTVFDMLLIDNTSYSIDNLDFIHVPENKGSKNKGVGELSMLKYVIDNGYIDDYEYICYITGRHLWICPYFFEKVLNMEYGILVSNPNFMYINGKYHEVAENLYNDMAFCMSQKIIKEYINYINFDNEKKGSEKWLYEFVHESKYLYQVINYLGLIRNDWQSTGNYIDLNNYHGV